MAVFSSVPTLHDLPYHADGDGTTWFYFEDFMNVLRPRLMPNDKSFQPCNLWRTIKGYRLGSRITDNFKELTFQSLLRIVFQYTDSFAICRHIANEIETALTSGTNMHNPDKYGGAAISINELYNTIARKGLKATLIENAVMDKIKIDCSAIPSLELDLVDQIKFSILEWNRICLFEYHFSQEFNVDTFTSYEEGVKCRWDYFTSIQQSNKMALKRSVQCKHVILEQMQRKAVAEASKGIHVTAQQVHIPCYVEMDIMHELSELCPELESVACVDCTVSCKHDKGFHLYVEINTHELDLFNNVAILAQKIVADNHHTLVQEIIYCSLGAFKEYHENSGTFQRFSIRDALKMGKLQEQVLFAWRPKADGVAIEYEPQKEKCPACFPTTAALPLDWQTLDTLQEWHIYVPLHTQIFLESFINLKSLQKSGNPADFLKGKVSRLYAVCDMLLNIFNRNYSGVVQDLNTSELAMNYHCAQTVFSVANTSGASRSYNTAERYIKHGAEIDLCYYNTYIKSHPIEYTSISGTGVFNVSLKNCLLVLYMDNLVRLSFHRDPARGQGNSAQLAMLPITVKGLPCDAAIIETWHDCNICDGTPDCQCKDPVVLSKSDVSRVLLQHTTEEADAASRFSQLCTWGLHIKWKKLMCGELKDFVLASEKSSDRCIALDSIHEDEQLNTSMGSLHLNESSEDNVQLNESMRSLHIEESCEMSDHNFLFDASNCHPNTSKILPASDSITEYHMENEDDITDDADSGSDDELYPLMCQVDPHDNTLDTLAVEDCWPLCEDSQASDSYEATPLGEIKEIPMVIKDQTVMSNDSTNPADENKPNVLLDFDFHLYNPPNLIHRHPPPAVGRDDDKAKLREILDDFLVKTGYFLQDERQSKKERVLFGPDHKIGKNLLALMSENPRYTTFLPEFPLLHLRKSKITILGSAYKNAGIIQLLKFMKDDDKESDWAKLVSAANIDAASRVVRRLGQALHLTFLILFIKHLSAEEAINLIEDLQNEKITSAQLAQSWNGRYAKFIADGTKSNATFALHTDMMTHCDEVAALYLAERLGGPDTYHLVLACVKASLPFAFLNGASAYASYTTHLLYEHSRAGVFHQGMKQTLYSTSHKGSRVNFSLDTQREMDHKDALKGFRPGSTVKAISSRLSMVDTLNSVHEVRSTVMQSEVDNKSENNMVADDAYTSWDYSKTDLEYIRTVATLIIRRGLSTEYDPIPRNLYMKKEVILSEAVLDKKTWQVGKYLVQRYVAQNGLFGLGTSDVPNMDGLEGPKPLLTKVQKGKSVTVKRTSIATKVSVKSVQEKKETVRLKKVAKAKKQLDHMSSAMNTCQAIVKPDCSKPTIQKSRTMKTALLNLVKSVCNNGETYIQENVKASANNMKQETKLVTVEFAGVKFKSRAISGKEYIKSVENGVINKLMWMFPNARRLIICEEKYAFTPDDFKAATRAKRVKASMKSIAHQEEMLNDDRFDKEALITTPEGRSLVSTYLAKKVSDLNVRHDIILDIDSEFHLEECQCEEVLCLSPKFTVPIRAIFTRQNGFKEEKLLETVRQCKGEAEMSQVDWIVQEASNLEEGDAVTSVVTSGDIDAVAIHLFAVAHRWPRHQNGKFKNPVYVFLQKPSCDVYNITGLLEHLEDHFADHEIGMKIAMALCMGGNDFLPKFHGHTHDKILKLVTSNATILNSLIKFIRGPDGTITEANVDSTTYKEVVKYMYSPPNVDAQKLTSNQVRQLSIKRPRQNVIRNSQMWMPPDNALNKLVLLLQCQLDYLMTVGNHDARLPDFLNRGCLKKIDTVVEYDLGDDCRVEDVQHLLSIPDEELNSALKSARVSQGSRKRTLDSTPQKGHRRKGPKTSTPRKTSATAENEVLDLSSL